MVRSSDSAEIFRGRRGKIEVLGVVNEGNDDETGEFPEGTIPVQRKKWTRQSKTPAPAAPVTPELPPPSPVVEETPDSSGEQARSSRNRRW